MEILILHVSGKVSMLVLFRYMSNHCLKESCITCIQKSTYAHMFRQYIRVHCMIYNHYAQQPLSTNNEICSFHNILKTTYINRNTNQRVDCLVHTLLDIKNDFLFYYNQKTNLSCINLEMIEEEERHHWVMKIPVASVVVREFSLHA